MQTLFANASSVHFYLTGILDVIVIKSNAQNQKLLIRIKKSTEIPDQLPTIIDISVFQVQLFKLQKSYFWAFTFPTKFTTQ